MDRATSHLRTGVRFACGLLALALLGGTAQTAPPPRLPRYSLDIQLDTVQHTALVHQRVVWTNRHARQATQLVFNAHSHYQLPDKDVGMTAKIFEILRMMPSESLDFEGHALDVRKVRLASLEWTENLEELGQPRKVVYQPGTDTMLPAPRTLMPRDEELSFHYQDDND